MAMGPTLKRSDRLGVWAVSARFGDHAELRLVRTLTF
jgi:hypothetical protein